MIKEILIALVAVVVVILIIALLPCISCGLTTQTPSTTCPTSRAGPGAIRQSPRPNQPSYRQRAVVPVSPSRRLSSGWRPDGAAKRPTIAARWLTASRAAATETRATETGATETARPGRRGRPNQSAAARRPTASAPLPPPRCREPPGRPRRRGRRTPTPGPVTGTSSLTSTTGRNSLQTSRSLQTRPHRQIRRGRRGVARTRSVTPGRRRAASQLSCLFDSAPSRALRQRRRAGWPTRARPSRSTYARRGAAAGTVPSLATQGLAALARLADQPPAPSQPAAPGLRSPSGPRPAGGQRPMNGRPSGGQRPVPPTERRALPARCPLLASGHLSPRFRRLRPLRSRTLAARPGRRSRWTTIHSRVRRSRPSTPPIAAPIAHASPRALSVGVPSPTVRHGPAGTVLTGTVPVSTGRAATASPRSPTPRILPHQIARPAGPTVTPSSPRLPRQPGRPTRLVRSPIRTAVT